MAEFTNSKIRVGTRLALRFDGQIVGLIQSVQASDDYGLEPVHVLGQLQCVEYVPTAARHQLTCSKIVMRNASLKKLNLEPTSAGRWENLPPQGNAVTGGPAWGQLRVLHGKTFDIEILDMQPGPDGQVRPLATYRTCYFNGGSLEVAANRVMISNAVFFAIDREGTETTE
jgi:hypothetical protein